jgi:hypothetical protein
MFDLAPPELSSTPTPADPWTAERYLTVLHPRDGRGLVGGLTITADGVRSHTLHRDVLCSAAATLVEQQSYVAMNPYFGPRGGERRLAGLNAVWLDLDTYRVPSLATLPRHEIAARILVAISDVGLPAPSLLSDSGGGFHCIWLLTSTSPRALPRWRAAMRVLTAWARPIGADPACVDPARVLRLPGSWHDGAAREVAIVCGDGARYPFEPLADSIFRAAGKPTRRELDAGKRRAPQAPPIEGAAPRRGGLSRRAAWTDILQDLETLVGHWAGTIPLGLRDLWLHVYCCALTWAAPPGTDILDTIVARAATAAHGLSPRDVARMMRPTVRRGLAAVPGQPRSCDPRYDYASDRLCDLLGVNRQLAIDLGFRQLLPADLRAERGQQRRTERRRAAGVLPRALWLAAHPISQAEPWKAEGISRATWYRRQAEARERRLRDAIGAMMTGSADIVGLRETGGAPLYEGVAQPALREEPTSALTPVKIPASRQVTPESLKKTKPAPEPQRSSCLDDAVSGSGEGCPLPATSTGTEPTVPQPALDATVLQAATQRLSHAEVGALTFVGLALARGPVHRLDLARRAQVPPVLLDRIDAWLSVSAETGEVTGLIVPGPIAGAPRGSRQGLLFDAGTAAPAPARKPKSLRGATIEAGVRVFGRAGISEQVSRPFLAGRLKLHGFGLLAEAIDALEKKLDSVTNPRGWIVDFLERSGRASAPRGIGTPSASARPAPAGREGIPLPAKKARPLATPEFLGISPGLAERIREQNRQLLEETERRFGHLRRRD